MLNISASVYAEKPQKDIHSFVGTFTRVSCGSWSCHFSVLNEFIFMLLPLRNQTSLVSSATCIFISISILIGKRMHSFFFYSTSLWDLSEMLGSLSAVNLLIISDNSFS